MEPEALLKKINTELPLDSMWDGFWVHYYKRGTLVISCSFDLIYYRDFDLVFKKVIFFNVPEKWSDSAVHTDDLLRLATPEEFHRQQPGFDTQGRMILAIDLHQELYLDIVTEVDGKLHREINRPIQKNTYYILAEHVYLVRCTPDDNNPVPMYEDPLADAMRPCLKNRVQPKAHVDEEPERE